MNQRGHKPKSQKVQLAWLLLKITGIQSQIENTVGKIDNAEDRLYKLKEKRQKQKDALKDMKERLRFYYLQHGVDAIIKFSCDLTTVTDNRPHQPRACYRLLITTLVGGAELKLTSKIVNENCTSQDLVAVYGLLNKAMLSLDWHNGKQMPRLVEAIRILEEAGILRGKNFLVEHFRLEGRRPLVNKLIKL